MTPFKITYGLEAIVPMEFMVHSLRLAVEAKLPMEESREHRIQKLLKLEQARQENILLNEMVQRKHLAQ